MQRVGKNGINRMCILAFVRKVLEGSCWTIGFSLTSPPGCLVGWTARFSISWLLLHDAVCSSLYELSLRLFYHRFSLLFLLFFWFEGMVSESQQPHLLGSEASRDTASPMVPPSVVLVGFLRNAWSCTGVFVQICMPLLSVPVKSAIK
jgi:hypothetical protein